MAKTSERIGRMLTVVPYVVRHPGIRLSELADVFDIPEDQLRADLDLLTMTGVPPYDPGTLIDFEIDDLDEGRITLRMADHLDKPARLTRPEAVSLYLRGTALLATPGLREAPELASALAKIQAGVDDQTLAELRTRVEAAAQSGSDELLETVRRAAEHHERMEFEYYAASRDELRTRRVDPEKVYNEAGRWYVVAWDLDAEGERLFRISRIKSATPTGETFQPRGLRGVGRELYSTSPGDVTVTLRLRPGARWVAEYYATDSEVPEGPDVVVSMPASSLAGIAKLILMLGDQAQILDPPELRTAARDLAERTLALYATAP